MNQWLFFRVLWPANQFTLPFVDFVVVLGCLHVVLLADVCSIERPQAAAQLMLSVETFPVFRPWRQDTCTFPSYIMNCAWWATLTASYSLNAHRKTLSMHVPCEPHVSRHEMRVTNLPTLKGSGWVCEIVSLGSRKVSLRLEDVFDSGWHFTHGSLVSPLCFCCGLERRLVAGVDWVLVWVSEVVAEFKPV